MTTLTYPIDNFDQSALFTFTVPSRSYGIRTGYLFRDDSTGKIYIMQQSAVMKSSYTDEDRATSARLVAQDPLQTGSVVTVDGIEYSVVIKGDYSDAGFLKAL
jgi:hypothetical protein